MVLMAKICNKSHSGPGNSEGTETKRVGNQYIIRITQKANARDKNDPPAKTCILDAREDQGSPLLPCLVTASVQLQGCELSVAGAYQAVVEAFRIINPEARPIEAHRDMANAVLQRRLNGWRGESRKISEEGRALDGMMPDDPRLI